LYGYDPELGIVPSIPPDTNPIVAEFIGDREVQMNLLEEQLLRAQNKMKANADKHRTATTFQVGEKVLLKLQPYAQSSLVNRSFPKLAMKYFGLYTILEKIGQAAYKLDLPASSQVHPTFHVSQLKTFVSDHTPVFKDLPKKLYLETTDVVPEAILGRWLMKKGNSTAPHVLIKWKHLASEFATWEDYYVIKARFPEASAWGQADFPAGVMSRTATQQSEDGDEMGTYYTGGIFS
jgi:hypothetical protein